MRSIQFGSNADLAILVYGEDGFEGFLREVKSHHPDIDLDVHAYRLPSPDEACMYVRNNFEGVEKCFEKGHRGDLCEHGGCHGAWNDDVRSMYLGVAVQKVLLWKHTKFNHRYPSVSATTGDLEQSLHDFTSFQIV